MEAWLISLCSLLAVGNIILITKIYFMKQSAREIKEKLAEKLTADTNTLIDICSNDKDMKLLAQALNYQLKQLRKERCRFQCGDLELKEAVTNISHDLRTPLTAICGYLDLLEKEEKSPEVERYIDIIKNRTEMLKQLTGELFQYSVIITSENDIAREPVIINSVLEESIAAFYAAMLEHNITPKIQMPDVKVCRNLDRAALSRIFANLLSNALKYSAGDLDITLSETGEIIFKNTASGLNEIQTGRLFDRFYTVETARQSTGLGLSIARTLVEQMDGTITAAYTDGKLCITILF